MRAQELLELGLPQQPQNAPKLTLQFAHSPADVAEAQRLRYKVFAEEMGAKVNGAELGLDIDEYDAHCEHLLVRDVDTQQVIGTYRMLNGATARRLGRFYADSEFDLTRLNHLRDDMVEIGRSCVHQDYRSGGTIMLLWSGILRYMQTHGYHYVMGCASISMADGGRNAASIYNALKQSCLSPAEYRVFPRCELPLEAYAEMPEATLPPLIKGYVRIGSYICGAPAWDPDFNTADLPVLLPMSRINPRYARHFLTVEA